ncbi:MAG: serine/threonine protein kinase [Thermogemmatispora sp.]|uniref:serine/threonine-protein kinase n=1 Tax=Thermogemmatispora sp. TaxID=1968838 RepID=UPI00261316E5|nr:serine/threonine-protein kinase [Thermogemmatispora sp.]MBX5456935.1 serine/threonine protein kinase [Thermogemmatispora sp.]
MAAKAGTLRGEKSAMVSRIDQRLGGYRLVRLLGQGHMTRVYLGEHVHTGAQAALKVVEAQLSSQELAELLIRAQILTRLEHPHIVRVFDFGAEDGQPFIVMAYAPHGTLRERHPRGIPLPLPTVVSYVRQVAAALQYIHGYKLIHRDIKPHNMLLGPDNQVWLSDFDIATVARSAGYRREKLQGFEGTVPYAAPEQLRGRPRLASDQYALGVVVYEWLTGDWPFLGTTQEIALQHQIAPPPSLRERAPTVPPLVEQVVLRALAKDPNERFPSVEEFARELERASRQERLPLSPLPRSQFKSPLPFAPAAAQSAAAPAAELPPSSVVTTPRLVYRGHSARVASLAWASHGRYLASSSQDESVQIWDSRSGETLLVQRGLSLEAPAIVWSPDGRYLAMTDGLLSEVVQLLAVLPHDARAARLESPAGARYEGLSERILALAWSPDGKYLAAAGEERVVLVWEIASRRVVCTYRGHHGSIAALAWSPDSRQLASGGEDRTVHVWEPTASTGGNIRIYYGHHDKVNAVAWSPDGRFVASASDDQSVQVWEARDPRGLDGGREPLCYYGHNGGVTSVAWSPDGRLLASGSVDEQVHVWRADGEVTPITPLLSYRGHSDWVSTVAWSPTGDALASGSWDGTVQIWEPSSGKAAATK